MSLAWSNARVPIPPLRQLAALDVHCDGCGHKGRLEEGKLQELDEKGFAHVHDLEGKLVCSACRERRQLALLPFYRRAVAA
jgi:hypothetical protein